MIHKISLEDDPLLMLNSCRIINMPVLVCSIPADNPPIS